MDVHLHPTTTGQLFDGLSSSRKQIIFLIGPVFIEASQSLNSIGWIQILFPDYWKFSKNWKMHDHCIKCQK